MKTAAENRRENLTRLVQQYEGARKLARAAGVQENYLSQVKSGFREAGPRFARKLEAALGLPAGWLDQPRAAQESNVRQPLPDSAAERIIPLLVYSQLQQRAKGGEVDSIGGHFIKAAHASEAAFGLVIEGASMEPEFAAGDHVVIDPALKPEPGDYVAAIVPPSTPVFAKYRPREASRANGAAMIELLPCNADFPAYRLPEAKILIIGTMIEHRRFRRRR